MTFRVQSGPAFIANGAVTATNTGAIVLVAEQTGNAVYSPVTLNRTLNRSGIVGERLGEWPGYPRGDARGVFVQGTLAYVALGAAGLAIFGLGNPVEPVRLNGFTSSGGASAVQVNGNLAYVAGGSAGLQVIDVSNPARPVTLGGSSTFGFATSLHVVRSIAYVAEGSAGLQVIDVSNLASPVRLSGLETADFAWAVQVVGNLAYVAVGARVWR